MVVCLQESSPDTSQLPRFDIPFVPSVIGEGPVIISLQVMGLSVEAEANW